MRVCLVKSVTASLPQSPPVLLRDLATSCFRAGGIGRWVLACQSICSSIGPCVSSPFGMARDCRSPVAAEGDAERAVRAALDLVGAVADLGAEAGVPGLAARAGVVTGEAAVTLGATHEGMVAGDAVNTAARVQAAAEAGQVLADATTQRLAESGIGFADAGEHALKGRRNRRGSPSRAGRPARHRRPPGPGDHRGRGGLHRRRLLPARRRAPWRPRRPRPRRCPRDPLRVSAVGMAASRPRRLRPGRRRHHRTDGPARRVPARAAGPDAAR
jgi:hypothetical protein